LDRPENLSGQGGARGERLPIKLILPNQGQERRVPGGGNPPTPFRTVTLAYGQSLSNQLAALKQGLAAPMSRVGAAPARVQVIPEAAAKRHRPELLFSDLSRPILGAHGSGELLIIATPHDLDRFQALILYNTSDRIVKE